MDDRINALSNLVFDPVSAQIVEQVTPEVVAQALLKSILVARPPNPYEIKEGKALPVRQATVEEVRAGKPHGA